MPVWYVTRTRSAAAAFPDKAGTQNSHDRCHSPLANHMSTTMQVVRHIEFWSVSGTTAILQILKPSRGSGRTAQD